MPFIDALPTAPAIVGAEFPGDIGGSTYKVTIAQILAAAAIGSGANFTGVTKASGAATDIISVADPSTGGFAVLISGIAGGDEFFRIGDALNVGFAWDTSFGLLADGSQSGTAVGYNAAGAGGVAVGLNSNGVTGTAVGIAANGSQGGTAVGRDAIGTWQGASVGDSALSGLYGAAIGKSAAGGSYGAAAGHLSDGSVEGAAVGLSSNGSWEGAAVGKFSNGSYGGAVVGQFSSGNSYGAAVGSFADGHGLGNVALGGSTGPGTAAIVPDTYIDTVQLGRGTSTVDGGLHFRGFNVLSATGFLNIARLTGVTKASGAGTVDIVSVNDPSAGGSASPLITGVAGGDVFFNIGDSGNSGLAADTSLGILANGANSGAAVGYNASGAFSGAAVGRNASGDLSGAAVGHNASGAFSGVAVGYNAVGGYSGAVVGYNASGPFNGAAIGYSAVGGYSGAAIGAFTVGDGLGNVAIGGSNVIGTAANVPNGFLDTVQLGRGTATVTGGLHFRGFNLLDAAGEIPDARLSANASLFGNPGGSSLQVLRRNSLNDGFEFFTPPVDAGGTVTSVGLDLPSFLTVSASPVTSSGTLTAVLASQAQRSFLVAPAGAAGVPTFRVPTLDELAAPIAPVAMGNQPITGLAAVNGLAITNTSSTLSLASGSTLSTVGAFPTILRSTNTTDATLPAGITTLLATNGIGTGLTDLNAANLAVGTIVADARLSFGSPVGAAMKALRRNAGNTAFEFAAPTVSQAKISSYGANANLTTSFLASTLLPPSGSGDLIHSISITPLFATSVLRMRFDAFGASAQKSICWGIFVDGTCIKAGESTCQAVGEPVPLGGGVQTTIALGTLATRVVTVRVGPGSGAGSVRLNGTTTAARFGAAGISTFTVEEINP